MAKKFYNAAKAATSRWRNAARVRTKIVIRTLNMPRLYLVSSLKSHAYEDAFEDVETYCVFIGNPRSGHSLIGALLDAHPHVIMAHEFDALYYVQVGFSKEQLFYLLLENSRVCAQTGRKSSPYSYAVPNQWQGQFTKLRVIGDKRGGRSTRRLYADPQLMQRLRDTVGARIKFIHVIRNPYDNISTLSRRRYKSLTRSMEHYFYNCGAVAALKKQIDPPDIFEVKHEDFIAHPGARLRELCHFLGVDAAEDYLRDCASIIYELPHKSRYDVKWSPELLDLVKGRMRQFPFLQGYTFED